MHSIPVVLVATAAALILFLDGTHTRHQHRSGSAGPRPSDDLSMWISKQQIKTFSDLVVRGALKLPPSVYMMPNIGLDLEIYVISNGRVLEHLLDPELENKLPIIPNEVSHVNFTWKSGAKKYFYNFFRLKSYDETILKTPTITIKKEGRVPKQPKEFSILLPCTGNSGIAEFGIALMIETRKRKPLERTPIELNLRKECTAREPNSGPCPDGYLGPPHCKKALCYPSCLNGGNCTAPGVCSCPTGYQGPYCEGGLCSPRCENGGKCIKKNICKCPKGYLGLHCELSRCVIPCLNGGKCKGENICQCPEGFSGKHCEIGRHLSQRWLCSRSCKHGTCQLNNTCICDPGWHGKLCNKNKPWA
ncbi:protein shifted isoform X2 [Pseudomyrmex gracilis]|uniref:protein shifted isoform X2 n=1 Tax=Pseudomyrmex gracilis TaxID=219809 RepID=UPI0009957CD4|nr:protein shifted isoform X2 [Pseudomyrmex gracilis]